MSNSFGYYSELSQIQIDYKPKFELDYNSTFQKGIYSIELYDFKYFKSKKENTVFFTNNNLSNIIEISSVLIKKEIKQLENNEITYISYDKVDDYSYIEITKNRKNEIKMTLKFDDINIYRNDNKLKIDFNFVDSIKGCYVKTLISINQDTPIRFKEKTVKGMKDAINDCMRDLFLMALHNEEINQQSNELNKIIEIMDIILKNNHDEIISYFENIIISNILKEKSSLEDTLPFVENIIINILYKTVSHFEGYITDIIFRYYINKTDNKFEWVQEVLLQRIKEIKNTFIYMN